MGLHYTMEEWVSKARDIHGDRYDYSQSYFRGSRKPITIVCREHGPFVLPLATYHVSKSRRGCRECLVKIKVVNCTVCGKQYRQRDHRSKFCSDECWKGRKVSVVCAHCRCTTEKSVSKSQMTKSGVQFCSGRCHREYRRERSKYSAVRLPILNRCQVCGTPKRGCTCLQCSQKMPKHQAIIACSVCGQAFARESGAVKRCYNCKTPSNKRAIRAVTTDKRMLELSAEAIRDQGAVCVYCQCETDDPTADHLIPVNLMPSLTIEKSNLVVACRRCNSQKQDKLPLDYLVWVNRDGNAYAGLGHGVQTVDELIKEVTIE